MSDNLRPFTPTELWEAFSAPHGSINKHLLLLYSLAVGVNAQRAIELGVGNSTRALRAAMQFTNGKLWSCDADRDRFAGHADADEHWSLALCTSREFLPSLEPPFDFALHDGAHTYFDVVADLRALLPLMRRYALVCIHDVQHSLLGEQMSHAVMDGVRGHPVSYVHLPFGFGMTVLRVEESAHASISTPWTKDTDTFTVCIPNPMIPASAAVPHFYRYLPGRLKQAVHRVVRL